MSMYNQKLVASLKANGKILREFKDTVYINFGQEYSILLKNLHTTRAVVNVYIDGDNAVPGGLVIDPGQSVDLERWIKNGNLTEGNHFRFIERTAKIEDGPRGIKVEDGLIRVEYQFEIARPAATLNNIVAGFPYYPPGVRSFGGTGDLYTKGLGSTYNVGGALRSVDWSKGEDTRSLASAAVDKYSVDNKIGAQASSVHDGAATMDWCANEVGITVPGSRSEQKFQTTTVGVLEEIKHSIVLRIVGDLGHNKPVDKPVTVDYKPECVTCGTKNKATAKFCSECGTALEIFA
jgi:hypothetical protein